jgi:hypothetical protein
MTTTVIRAKIDGDTLALVVSVNPFSKLVNPPAAMARAYIQTYHTSAATGRLALVSEQRYTGNDAEREAVAAFDSKHAATDAA